MNEELADGSAFAAAFRICLVTVDEKDSTASRTLRSRQENPFVNLDPGKERPIDRFVVLPIEIMIPPHLQVAGLCRSRIMEFGQEFIDRGVGDVGLVEIIVLPEFLGIAQFDVGETFSEIILQGATIDQGVLGEIIGPGTVPSVHVGHDDQLHAGGHGQVPDPFQFWQGFHLAPPYSRL